VKSLFADLADFLV